MEIKSFGVVGAGQMGSGIAQVAANVGGLNIIMNDIADEFVNEGYDSISKNLDRLVSKEKISADSRNETLNRLKKSTDINDMKDADFVIAAGEIQKCRSKLIFRHFGVERRMSILEKSIYLLKELNRVES